jgi:hypothetical protein
MTVGFVGGGGSGFLAADVAASEELEEESAAPGALVSVADDEGSGLVGGFLASGQSQGQAESVHTRRRETTIHELPPCRAGR